jgi:hypothetical protein
MKREEKAHQAKRHTIMLDQLGVLDSTAASLQLVVSESMAFFSL